MVRLKYFKYGYVSNLRIYNMLWLRFEKIIADIIYEKPNIRKVYILRIHGKSAKYIYVDESTKILTLQKFHLSCQYMEYTIISDI